jgi:chemotaxis protein CheC
MKKIELNEEELGFLTEIINIGAGNAAGALEQLLGAVVEMDFPDVRIVDPMQLSSLMDSLAEPVVGVKMTVLGDIRGDLFFIVSMGDKEILRELAEKATPGAGKIITDPDDSTLEEISNIIAGVFLYSIHEFCRLNASHTVPESSIDMLLSLLDESMADKMKVYPNFIWIKSTFKINGKPGKNIPVYFILVLTTESISKLKTVIQSAGERMYGTNA